MTALALQKLTLLVFLVGCLALSGSGLKGGLGSKERLYFILYRWPWL